jgi:type VI secretion system protein ImpL
MVSNKEILRIVLAGIGLTSVSALIYLAGPLISIGGWHPLQSYIVREIAILLLAAVFVAAVSGRIIKRKKASAKLADGIATADKVEDDTDVLKDRMKDALATLKVASGAKKDFLYDLPWYVLIGPPGSGKTTALVNSGLQFPLSRGATPAAISGVGGTRYCDWWFTEDAVLIDTAGRYTTQDSDAKVDKQSWLAFLDLLKSNRPRQPINGVLVAISLEDLMTLSPADISAHANAIRARLLELHDRLQVDFPVYALFTKGDLIAGFIEYFASLSDQGRRQVWGATFQTNDKTRNFVGEVPAEFDQLVERLTYDLTDRLQEEPTPSNRVLLYGFPAQIAALKRPIFDFLNQIFEPTRYHANATLRGFYFTSGTQQGTPIDRLIGALAKSFGAEQVGAQAYSGLGKSFFLTDLILKVIIGEAGWVSFNRAAMRRARIVKASLYLSISLVAVTAAGLWWVSYSRNKDLINRTQYAVTDYVQQAGPYLHETTIGDRDLHKVLPLLDKLRNLPPGYATRKVPTPQLATFGLSQRERLQNSAEQVYHIGLERLLRPRLVYRMEEVLEANKSNPGYIYEALKVYLMIGGARATNRDLVVSWMRNDWSDNLYPGAGNAGGRKALEDELNALLDLEGADEPLITLNSTLVDDCQRILGRLDVAERAYQLLKSQARSSGVPDWVAARHGGLDFAQVFESAGGEPIDTIAVPGFLTYAGFQNAFIGRLGTIAEQLRNDRWVLGEAGKQALFTEQLDSIGPNLLNLYTKDFIATWQQALGKLRLRRLNADKPNYTALNAAAAPTSPIRQLFESIRDETALTREHATMKDGTNQDKNKPAAPTLINQQGAPALINQQGAPGAAIEAAFKPFHQALEGDGGNRAIDTIIGNLNAISNSLQLMAVNPTQAQQATNTIQIQVANLKNNALRLPKPFSDMMLQAAGAFEGDVANTTYAQLAQAFNNQVYPPCRDLAASRYPLVKSESKEVPLADFGRLFGPNGYFDRFFSQNLAAYADTSKRDWMWRQDNPVARLMSPETLRQFQRASQIRDAFFATGGNIPGFSLAITPPTMVAGFVAKFEIGGAAATSSNLANPTPTSIQWPGAGGRTVVSLSSDPPTPGAQPSEIARTGQWALFRLLDSASVSPRPNGLTASFIVGGRDIQFQIGTGTVFNPLLLPALREFKCPTAL